MCFRVTGKRPTDTEKMWWRKRTSTILTWPKVLLQRTPPQHSGKHTRPVSTHKSWRINDWETACVQLSHCTTLQFYCSNITEMYLSFRVHHLYSNEEHIYTVKWWLYQVADSDHYDVHFLKNPEVYHALNRMIFVNSYFHLTKKFYFRFASRSWLKRKRKGKKTRQKKSGILQKCWNKRHTFSHNHWSIECM